MRRLISAVNNAAAAEEVSEFFGKDEEGGKDGEGKRCRALQQRLAGKEKRFATWHNHNISQAIVTEAVQNNSAIALEDLSGIRERNNTQPRSGRERRRFHSWAFSQLRQQLEYKAVLSGVSILIVSPAYTSQSCHICFCLGDRQGKSFQCINPFCSWSGDADFNAACVISSVGAAVSQPGGPGLVCEVRANPRATESLGLTLGNLRNTESGLVCEALEVRLDGVDAVDGAVTF